MKHTLYICTLILCSCGTKTTDSQTDKGIDSVRTELGGENFNDFFDRFKKDSVFQVERVRFPMEMITWDFYGDKPTTEKLEISNWRSLQFEYNDEHARREIDAYTQETRIYSDSAKLELRGVDNGILIDYDFIKLNEQWFLVSKKDYSD